MTRTPKTLGAPEDLVALRQELKSALDEEKPCIAVCGDTGCAVCGSLGLASRFEQAIEKRNLENKVNLKVTGCLGFCEQGPVVIVFPYEIFYGKVQPEDVEDIIEKTVLEGKPVERLLYEDPNSKRKISRCSDIPFYKKQTRTLLNGNWRIDPMDIFDYIAQGGYQAVSKALFHLTPEEIIKEVKDARLRGRGGAGFPTGLKWEICRQVKGDEKYIVCNADEGDPGAFMDRSILEGNPHAVLEGMIIAGIAVGARAGVIYVRAEYPGAIKKLENAIGQASELGLLGQDVLGSGFSFEITISKGAGAFVCGEDTALLRSAEGKVGEPRQKPPFPAEKGYRDKPTVVNNVETFANIPIILNEGAANYVCVGTEKSGGTKIFCLVGKVNNTGLVEVPLGITLREIIFDIGGGIKNGKHFKAVQTGGPSGGCLTEKQLDLKVDFEELARVGSIMGSGGMIVMDEDTCMVDIARYFLQFLKGESCGKCFSCREGISRMLEIVESITKGEASCGDLELLEELAYAVKDASMCALGQTSANPALSTLRYFRDEYLAHIEEKRCPAAVCRALIEFSINEDVCTGCGLCRKECPAQAIEGERLEPHRISSDRCMKCGVCMETCKFGAITKS